VEVQTYLSGIVAAHQRAHADRGVSLDEALRGFEPSATPRGFAQALRDARQRGLAVIAEVKRRSPSLGPLVDHLDVPDLVEAYAAGGATALSVLTDAVFFGGSPEDLQAARGSVALPVLRKDFTVDPVDVVDAAQMGADAVLLIAAVLDDAALRACASVATACSLDVIVEVHDRAELERALEVGATVVGVNQRDLVTFEVDHDRAVALAGEIPASVVAVAESGIRGAEDAAALAAAGYDAILVGEHLVRSGDPAAAVASLCGFTIAGRTR